MNNFVDAEGNAIADDDIGAALESGNLYAMPGTRVNMRGRDGVPVTVPAEQAGEALAAGMVPELGSSVSARREREEFGGAGQQAIAGLEGAARGLSFGLSDVLATGIGGESYRRGAEARQRINPITAGATEVLGAVAPAVLTLGATAPESAAGLAARGLTAIPRVGQSLGRLAARGITGEAALSRMAARAAETGVAGAFEGMMYGAGSAAGESALKGNEITAEKILSGGAHGALIGGLLGGGLGALSKAKPSAASVGDDMLLRAKTDKLDAAIAKQTAAEQKLVSKAELASEKAAERSSFLDRIAADQAIAGLKPGPRVLKRAAKQAADVDGLLQEAGQDYLQYEIRTGPLKGKRIFHGAKDPVDAIDDINHAWQETDDILRAHKATAAQTIAANPQLAPDLAELGGRIESEIAAKVGKAEMKPLANLLKPIREAQQGQLFGQRGIELEALESTRQNLIEAAEKASGPAQVQALRSARLAVDDALRDATEGALERAGVDTTLFRNESRMHRSLSLVKDAADELKVSQHSARGGIENSAAGYALAAALSGNFGAALGIGATMMGQNLLRNRASGIVAELARRVARSDVRLAWGAKALSGDGFKYPVRTALNKTLTGGAAERFFSRLSETAADPTEYIASKTEKIAPQYPELAAVMGQTIRGDLQYLAENIPQRYSRAGSTLTPAAAKPVGSKASADVFWEKVHALEDPGYVVDEMLSGRVPTAGIEALKERRPNEWERLRNLVMQECVVRRDELPFKRRITLGLAFDFPSDQTLLPGVTEGIQMTFAPPAQGGGGGKPAPGDQSGTIEAMQLSGETI